MSRIFTIMIAVVCGLAVSACDSGGGNNGDSTECVAGTSGCECAADNSCNDGLSFFNGICVPGDDNPDDPDAGDPDDPDADDPDDPDADDPDDPDADDPPVPGTGLAVGDAAARSCEVVLEDPDEKLKDVNYDGVQGRDMRRGSRLAIAFHALDDESIVDGAVSFGQADLSGINVTVSRCFGADGAVLDGVGVTIAP